MGDRVDGYYGVPGVGPKTAEKILGEPKANYWFVIKEVYKEAGLSEAVALQNARLAHILRHGEYDDKTNKPETMDTQTRKIIAFAGPATVGKSTAAKVLLNRGFKRLSFADPIRDMLRAIGVPEDKLTVDKETPVDLLCGKTCRHAMQKLGTGRP